MNLELYLGKGHIVMMMMKLKRFQTRHLIRAFDNLNFCLGYQINLDRSTLRIKKNNH